MDKHLGHKSYSRKITRTAERWATVPRTTIEVSNKGRARHSKTGKARYTKLCSKGYFEVRVYFGNCRFDVCLHILIMEAFRGKRIKGYQINHKDGNKLNNQLVNLEYVTPRQNVLHAIANGLADPKDPTHKVRGEAHPRSKLTEIDVHLIRNLMCDTGRYWSYAQIARIFRVSPACIEAVVYRRSWTHVENDSSVRFARIIRKVRRV